MASPEVTSTEQEWCICGHPLAAHTAENGTCTLCIECDRYDPGDGCGRIQELTGKPCPEHGWMGRVPGSNQPCPHFHIEVPETFQTQGKSLVDGERQEQHGDPVVNLKAIAAGWSEILGVKVTAHQVALMMVWFKIVRSNRNARLEENYADMEGYTEIARRCASAGET